MLLRQQRPLGIEGLVTVSAIGVGDHGVHDDLATVSGDAGAIAAKHDGQSLGVEADAAQAPDVVVVQCRCP